MAIEVRSCSFQFVELPEMARRCCRYAIEGKALSATHFLQEFWHWIRDARSHQIHVLIALVPGTGVLRDGA
jgi:hypothetical protein